MSFLDKLKIARCSFAPTYQGMDTMKLIEIKQDGTIAHPTEKLPDLATHVLMATAETYKVTGYQPPLIGYLGEQAL